MAQYVPHYKDWQTVEKWRSAASVAFYAGVILSLLIAAKEYDIFNQLKISYPTLMRFVDKTISVLTVVTLIAYPVLDTYIEFWVAPSAEEKRKADFLDNTFGTHLLVANSVGYYTNDTLSPGLYKAAVNQFENAFFTHRVTEAMTTRKLIPLVLVLLVVIVMAVFGWGEQPLAIPMLQLLFSSAIAIDFIKYWLLRNRTKNIYEGWCSLFRTSTINQNPTSQTPEILRYWLMYETTLSRLQIGLDSKTFDKLNPSLSSEWQVIKSNLGIR